ncbi:MAG: hypothetical protein IT444_00340 [Phycisphaeraceae bacterium]|nr:hypothetical protein [Phycisphaeraceae bacterium]
MNIRPQAAVVLLCLHFSGKLMASPAVRRAGYRLRLRVGLRNRSSMIRVFTKSAACFLAVVLLVFAPFFGQYRVLCEGADGHVAVEGFAEHEACHVNEAGLMQEFAFELAAAPDAGECQHVELSSTQLTRNLSRSVISALTLAFMPAPAFSPTPPASACLSTSVIDFRAVPPPGSRCVASTVLLI